MNRAEKALVKETKALIKEVEAGDTAHAAWIAIHDRVEQLYDGRSQTEVGELLGKSNQWVSSVLAWDSRSSGTPHARDAKPGRRDSVEQAEAKKVLADPKKRAKVLASLGSDEIEAVIEDANDAAIERVRAKRSEHQTKPTAGDLMGDDPFKPDEFWADNVVIRVNRNARELNSLIERGGGLLLGAMEMERAFEYLSEAEKLIAEARAAAQEQLRDRELV